MSKEKIVFTNGCFDILHRGHMELLQFCSTYGKVIVGLNSDRSIKALKGASRPIYKQVDRKYLLMSCKYVDDVIIFDEDTPHNLIKKIKPDIIVKGGDYTPENVVGNDVCEKIIIFEYINGYSTTKAIQDIGDR
jgi:D-beta-D-heptose 7-phosphate kinase/D-beta-D-heptose 1-phosphate adenosyltransferase